MRELPADRCIHCRQSVLIKKPAWCTDHVTRTAFETRTVPPPEAAAAVPFIDRFVEARVDTLLSVIARVFDVDIDTLRLKRQCSFERKVARYLALYLAREDTDLLTCVGVRLNITSYAGQREAIRVVENLLGRETRCGEKFAKVFKHIAYPLPA